MSAESNRFQTIQVKALTRVEGEGALRVELDGDQVKHVELNIYEPPRFFESFLRGREIREVPDIVARICGICPVAYQMSATHALEKALGVEVDATTRLLRRLLYCGEWIESHSLHIYLLHAPDFLGYESGLSMAADHREVVERGLEMKRIGNELLEILGGRAIHPINVTVGGFYRAPDRQRLKDLLPQLEWGLEAAMHTARLVADFDFPDSHIEHAQVALKHSEEYPMNHGDVASTDGLLIPVEKYDQHFAERHVSHSTALHSVRLPEETPYLVGPLARFNLAYDQLPPRSRQLAESLGFTPPVSNNFRSIIVRAIETACAYEEAIRIVGQYQSAQPPRLLKLPQRSGRGCHATEAPRGLLYHCYEVDERGCIEAATIIPPTSQNQAQIEHDLKQFVPSVLDLPQDEATRRCEHLIRNYDPCISCATHFLSFKIERSKQP